MRNGLGLEPGSPWLLKGRTDYAALRALAHNSQVETKELASQSVRIGHGLSGDHIFWQKDPRSFAGFLLQEV